MKRLLSNIRHIHIKRGAVIKTAVIVIIALLAAAVTERCLYARPEVKKLVVAMLSPAPFIQYFVNMHLRAFVRAMLNSLTLLRIFLFFIFYLFVGFHFLFPIKKMYSWIFEHRYILSLALFLFLVLGQFHGSSIAMFDQVIQPGQGSSYVQPVLGKACAIRSDEWLVATPDRLATQFGNTHYGRYNYILRGTKTSNLAAGNMYLNYSSLGTPLFLGYFLFGEAYGLSIKWWGTIFLCLLVSVEMCMIITKKRKLLSTVGGFLITFSSYFMWWSLVDWVLAAQAAIVCGYYFLYARNRWSKILLALGVALSISNYCVELYPAWQVPAGFLFLGILIWILWENRIQLKQLKIFDWVVVACALIFAGSIVYAYMKADTDYIQIITNTVYPGHRQDYGGNYNLNKLFYGFISPLLPFLNFENPSEAGIFVTFFPIPMILSIVLLIRSRFKDLLSFILLIFSGILISYICIGWPAFLCKITLMDYTMSGRAIDILAFAQLYLLLACLSRFEGVKKFHPITAIVLACGTTAYSVYICLHSFTEVKIATWYIIAAAIIMFMMCYIIMIETSYRWNTAVSSALIIIMFISGATVNPLQKGLDAIYSKPLAKEVASIVKTNPNAKWAAVSCGLIPQQFLVACGAPTINSVNFIPNLELWERLDPSKKYSNIYNRYCHVAIVLTEDKTSFKLVSTDYIQVNLSYSDIKKAGITYLYSLGKIESKDGLKIKRIYDTDGCDIYQLIS